MLGRRIFGAVSAALVLSGAVQAAPHSERAAWPNGPFVTSGRYILDASGTNVTYAGVNWPGHADVMIPEGLQYQSIESIVDKIKSLGMNAIRLTYAIEMIDQIYANNGDDIPIETALTKALGANNGRKVLAQITAKNPQFSGSTTRLEIFDAVVAECAKQEIYIHLDNHISKGMWCCSTNDGNAWWGDRDFNVDNWVRGLAYMANHGKSWPNLMSMSLRNEPREPDSGPARSTYNWQSWYGYIKQGTEAIHSSHPDVLIFLSGLGFDTTLTPVTQGTALTPGSGKFNLGDFPGYADKLVLELHNYENSATSCSSLQGNLERNGFSAMGSGAANQFPVQLTEFGFQMDASTWRGVYSSCLADYFKTHKAGWFLWVLAGSYYIRSGTQDYEEAWGLLSHDWSTWRSPSYVNGMLLDMVKGTLA